MLSAQTLLAALVQELPEVARRRRRQRVFAFLSLIVGLLGLAGAIWVFVSAALYGWATADWERLLSATTLPLPFLLLTFIAVLALAFPPNGTTFRSRTLRDAIEQGDAQIAPVAASQPAPLEASAGAADPVEFRTLRRLPDTTGPQNSLFLPWLIVPVQFGTLFFSLPQALGWSLNWVDSPFYWLTLVIPFLVIIAVFAMYIVTLTSGPRRRWDITASAEGLSWRLRGRRAPTHVAPWGTVRALIKATYRDATAVGERTAFVVDAGDAVFGWVLGQNSKDAEFVESERLSRTIITRTGLPLRELASALGSFSPKSLGAMIRLPALPEVVAAEMAAARKRLGRRFLVLVPAFLALVLIGVASIQAQDRLQSAQHSYFAGLAPQVYASRQLFHDSLASDDGQWPLATPSATSAVSRIFAQGSYQVSGGSGGQGDATVALTQPVFGNAAVEVTVRTVGFSDAGLAVRAQGSDNLIAFTVNQADRSWMLAHYQFGPGIDQGDEYDTFDGGTSSAIRTAPGSVNHLLLVMRGDTYLLYVNDHLVDVASQRYDDPKLTEGTVGVFVADSDVTGVFTDFVVHATPPETSISWV